MSLSFCRSLLTAMFLALTCLWAAAAPKTFDLSVSNMPVDKVIQTLKEKSGYDFVYQKDVVKGISPLTYKFHHVTLDQVLNRVFLEDLNIEYEIVDHTVILSKSRRPTPYYKREISGMVTDAAGEPLIGATVYVENSQIGTSTDLDGMFSVMVEAGKPRLRVSYVGMKTRTVEIAPGEKSLVIQLEEEPLMMSEVIVTGYANIKRESATGSYQTINAADLAQRHTATISENLEGLVPGLVSYDTGNGKTMSVRGTGTFSASSQPLVVVDGLPIEGSMESVNSYDIENMTVLKDAAAAAIYGARASNGVIVITTKKGKQEKPVVEFNADVTVFNKRDYGYMGYASAAEMIELERYNFDYVTSGADPNAYNMLRSYYDAGRFTAISPVTLLLMKNRMGAVSDSELSASLASLQANDYLRQWQDAIERRQVQQQYNLSIRNKGKYLTSSLAFNYMHDNNGFERDNLSTIRFSYNGIWKAASFLDFNFGFSLVSERSKTNIFDAMWGSATSFLPYMSVYRPDGTLNPLMADINPDEPALADARFGFKDVTYNPVSELGRSHARDRRNNIRTYIHANADILPGWTASAQFQFEDISYRGDSFYSGDSYRMRSMYNLYTADDPETGLVKHYIPSGGQLSTVTSDGSYYTFRAQTQYASLFADRHDIDLIAGFEFREQRTRTYGNILLGYDDQTQTNANSMVNWGVLKDIDGTTSAVGPDYTMSGAPDGDAFSTGDILHRFYSIYFTANYIYDTRYTFTGSFRIDKTDLFGADPKFRGRPLWSVGLGWNLHNEAFLRDAAWLDVLKLRGSYGLTGNIANNISSYLTATIGVNDIYGDKMATLDTPPNDQLRWEKTSTWNAGIDFSIFGGRLAGAFDVYTKNGSDILALTDLDPTTGWSQLTINNGKVRNSGVELQLNGRIIDARDRNSVALSADFTFAYNHNKVTKTAHKPATGYDVFSPGMVMEGYPVNSLFSYDFAGMATDGTLQYYSWRDHEGNVRTSDITNEEFTVADVVYSGSLDPKFTASLTPLVQWRGFSLSAMLSYYGGHVMRVDTDWSTSEGSALGYYGLGSIDAIPAAYLDYWRSGDSSRYPANGAAGGAKVTGTAQYSSANVAPADCLRLRNIVLGYSFRPSVCKALRMSDLRLRLQLNNIALWHRNKFGIDPEANNPFAGARSLRTPFSYTFSVFFGF